MSTKLTIERLVVGQLDTNCYVVFDPKSQEAIIIDPGDGAEVIADFIQQKNLKPQKIMATHGHFDHILAATDLQLIFGLPFLIHKSDEFLVKDAKNRAAFFTKTEQLPPPPLVSGYLQEGDKVALGGFAFTVWETPGHTPGSVSFYLPEEKVLFCGDLIFAGGLVGRTDFSYSSEEDLSRSVRRVLSLSGDTVIMSGHGDLTTCKIIRGGG